jgi:hypothetical protein
MSNLTTLTDEQKSIASQKGAAWQKFGITLSTAEFQLQAKAQQSILKIKMPQNIKDVPEAESLLKEIKQNQKSIETDRKSLTTKLDEVTSRLMLSEKSLIDPIKNLETKIIEIKKEEEKRLGLENKKIDEKKSLKEKLINIVNEHNLICLNKIQEIVFKAYNHALGEGNISLVELPEFIVKCENRLKASDFTLELKPMSISLISEIEYLEIVKETVNIGTDYIEVYKNELKKKFSDYDVAVNNKEQAIKIAKEKEIEERKKQEEEKINKDIAAKLESMAIMPDLFTQETKALKKVYKVKMEESPENAIRILSATISNWDKCSSKIGVKKWFQLSVTNCIVALEKIKNEDNTLSITGIVFEEESKL